MLSRSYELYIADIINLTKSLVIKSVHTIELMNSFLSAAGHTISEDAREWKYYKNLSGVYYTGNTGSFDDVPMEIFSSDLDVIIPFTREHIINSPVTYNELLTYGQLYRELVLKYPEQELLIKGILTPIDAVKAINAKSLEILSYSKTYVCPNETNLIPLLQEWIYRYETRWDVSAFAVSDKLYPAAFLALLYLAIPNEIINIRLNNCKTPYVHDFHLWNYLGGYYRLDKFRNRIPREQALFLYRNIDYITFHGGQKSTLDMLNDRFALPFGLQLYSHVVRQDTANALSNLNVGKLTELTNTTKFNKYPYGQPGHIEDASTYVAPTTVIAKLEPLAILNPENVATDYVKIINSVSHTVATELPTGIIECNTVSNTAAHLVNILQEKLNNWLYLSSVGILRYKKALIAPSLGTTPIPLSSNEAIIILMYIANHIQGLPSTNIPTFTARQIPALPAISNTQIQGLVEKRFLSGTVPRPPLSPLLWNRFTDALDAYTPTPVSINTIEAFLTHIDHVVSHKIRHILLPTLEHNGISRSQLVGLASIFYNNFECSFTNIETYDEFFLELGIDLTPLSIKNLLDIAKSIVKLFIGLDSESTHLQSPYSDMAQVLEIVSSYTVQYVLGTTSINIEPLDWAYSLPIPTELKFTGHTTFLPLGLEINPLIPPVTKIKDSAVINTDNMLETKVVIKIYAELDIGLKPSDKLTYKDIRTIHMNGSLPISSPPVIHSPL